MGTVKILSLLVVGFTFCMTTLFASGEMKSQMPMTDKTAAALAALDHVEKQAFYIDTYIAYVHNTVRDLLLNKPEVQLLVAQHDTACPLMIDRLNTSLLVEQKALIVYFIVFQQSGCVSALEPMARYISSLNADAQKVASSPWHPFRYGVQALAEMTNQDLGEWTTAELFERKNVITETALAWLGS